MKFFSFSQGERKEDKEPLSREQYATEGRRVFDVAWHLLATIPWRLEKQTSNGDTVHSANLPGRKKVFKAQGIVNMTPRALLNLMFYGPDKFPEWNPVIVESRKLQDVDENTHISYQVTAEQVGGLVSRRDFVILSHWGIRESCYVLAGVSVHHPDAPSHNSYVRGENGPSCWVMRPVAGNKSQCLVEWYLDSNMRGWLPQYLVDAAFSSVMLSNLNNIRAFAQKQNN